MNFPTVEGGFTTLVSDPPWQFSNKATRASAEDHYPTMDFYEIAALRPQRVMAPDAHLYLWTTDAHLELAFGVMEAWGFVYKQSLVWVKVGDTGKLQIGLGNYYRHAHELCLFGVRGRLAGTVKNLPSVFWAPRGRHSEKPAAFFQMVEQFSPGPYLEMFARTTRPNWAAWGNEVPQHDFAELEKRVIAQEIERPIPCSHGNPSRLNCHDCWAKGSPTGRFQQITNNGRLLEDAPTYPNDPEMIARWEEQLDTPGGD